MQVCDLTQNLLVFITILVNIIKSGAESADFLSLNLLVVASEQVGGFDFVVWVGNILMIRGEDEFKISKLGCVGRWVERNDGILNFAVDFEGKE